MEEIAEDKSMYHIHIHGMLAQICHQWHLIVHFLCHNSNHTRQNECDIWIGVDSCHSTDHSTFPIHHKEWLMVYRSKTHQLVQR